VAGSDETPKDGTVGTDGTGGIGVVVGGNPIPPSDPLYDPVRGCMPPEFPIAPGIGAPYGVGIPPKGTCPIPKLPREEEEVLKSPRIASVLEIGTGAGVVGVPIIPKSSLPEVTEVVTQPWFRTSASSPGRSATADPEASCPSGPC